MDKKTFKIITLGCKVNQYESVFLEETLLNNGWHQVDNQKKADLIIVNTCIVTQKAGHQSRQEIRKVIRENNNGLVAAIGCYAQVYPDELLRIEGVSVIAGNIAKGRLADILCKTDEIQDKRALSDNFEPNMPFEFLPIKGFSKRSRPFLKIQDGCQNYCTYCIVPFARGPYRSLPPDKVLIMIEALAKKGYKEITLTGIHLGKYGIDLPGNLSLNKLIRIITREKNPVRIRLSSLDPHEIDSDLIEMVATEKYLCRYFHISLQSGDDKILKRMNRKYTLSHFEKLVNNIYSLIPHAAIGVDIMAGFPGEDHLSHKNASSFIQELPISYLHVFPFSARPGTPAASFKQQVEHSLIKKRAFELRELGKRKKICFYNACLNNIFEVIPEGWHQKKKKIMKGLTDNYLPVLFTTDHKLENCLLPVKIEKIEKDMVIGSTAI